MISKNIENFFVLTGGIEKFHELYPHLTEGTDVPVIQKPVEKKYKPKVTEILAPASLAKEKRIVPKKDGFNFWNYFLKILISIY